jgi:hypothetical protein
MLTDSQIEAAHPEAFDFVFGNLRSAEGVKFIRHLIDCLHCRAVVDEYSEIGEFVKLLPPHVEPSADLEDRTVTAMVRALTGQRAKTDCRTDTADHTVTRVYPISQRRFPKQAEPETWVQPSPEVHHRAAPKTPFPQSPDSPPAPPEAQTHATVIALPLWRRHSRRVSAAVGVAAAVIIAAAIVIPLRAGGGSPAQTSVAIPLHVTDAGKAIGYGSATGRATARQAASGSWNITLSVAHLKHFDPAPWYGCWYVSRDGQQVASAGTFLVPASGSATLPMTSAVDPHDFPTMQITISEPNSNGALSGTVILSGHAL